MVPTFNMCHEGVESADSLKNRVRVKADVVGVTGSYSGEVSLDVQLTQSDVAGLESMFFVDASTDGTEGLLKGFNLTRKIMKTGGGSSERIESGWVYFSYNPHLGATHLCPAVLMQAASADGGTMLCYILRADDSIEEKILPASRFD